MIDLDTPVPPLELCKSGGHVACVSVYSPSLGWSYCWGWHLVAWDPDWRDQVQDLDHVAFAVERLATDAVGRGWGLMDLEWTGRTAPWVDP